MLLMRKEYHNFYTSFDYETDITKNIFTILIPKKYCLFHGPNTIFIFTNYETENFLSNQTDQKIFVFLFEQLRLSNV